MHIISSRSILPLDALDRLLQQCYNRPASSCSNQLGRRYSVQLPISKSEKPGSVKNVAVLGGGITGLAAAHFLSKESPSTRITLLEGGNRLGGWLHSQAVETSDGTAIFEKGPRTLRPTVPNGILTLDLIRDLGLEDQILSTSKNSVAAQNRYVYYPDHLVRMPGPGMSMIQNLITLFREPVFSGLFSALYNDYSVKKRHDDLEDESIASFFARRLNSKIADNVLSAVLHGIYAGDITKLSVRSILPLLWNAEGNFGSVFAGVQDSFQTARFSKPDWSLMEELSKRQHKGVVKAAASSVFTLKGGLGELAHGLEASLRRNPMIHIQTQTRVANLQLDEADKDQILISIQPSSNDSPNPQQTTQNFTHAISTLSASTLSKLVTSPNNDSILKPFTSIPSVSVMVVNLYYTNPSLLPIHGFGYLLPRSVPFTQNPERALGVVFDSDATIGVDSVPGTKLTVMLGGHWWDGWDSYPSESGGAEMAKAVLERHLGIMEQPDALLVSMQRDCIPQYTVGHHARLKEGTRILGRLGGRLRVAGNSYTGVGLNDCVRSAREVVRGLWDKGQVSGLEWFFEKWEYEIKAADLVRYPWMLGGVKKVE